MNNTTLLNNPNQQLNFDINEFGAFDISSLLGETNLVEYEIGRGAKNLNIKLLNFKNILHGDYLEGIYKLVQQETLTNRQIEQAFNSLMNACNANHKSVLGCTSDLFGEFLKKEKKEILGCKTFNELRILWKSFYDKKRPNAILKAAKKMTAYQREIDRTNSIITGEDMPSEEKYIKMEKAYADYIAHLVYFNSPRGFVIERIVLTFLSSYLGWSWVKSNISEEAIGIDGKLGNYLITIKPESFFKQKTMSPLYGSVITYEFKEDNLIIRIKDTQLWEYFKDTDKKKSEKLHLNNIISNGSSQMLS